VRDTRSCLSAAARCSPNACKNDTISGQNNTITAATATMAIITGACVFAVSRPGGCFTGGASEGFPLSRKKRAPVSR